MSVLSADKLVVKQSDRIGSNPTGTQRPANRLLLCAAMFMTAFLACVVQHIFLDAPGRLFIFDTCHFIETSKQMALAIAHLCGASTPPSTTFGELLMLDGLAMPLLGSIAISLSGILDQTRMLLLMQGAIHGVTAALMFACATRLGLPVWGALLTAALWAFYPGALACTGSFLSEPTCALLSLTLVWCGIACKKNGPVLPWITLGFVVEMCANSRTALLAPAALVCLCIAFAARPSKKDIAISIVGIAAAALPFLLLTSIYCGKPELMPSRVPTQNMALGSDTNVGGWETVPIPPLTLANYERSPIATLTSAWKKAPSQMFVQTMNKCGRLWLGIFNDFHDAVLGVPFEFQLWWHRILIALAVSGLTLALCFRRLAPGYACCVAVALGHFAYLPFEALPRYSYSAIPAVILLGAIGLASARSWRSRALVSTAALLAVGGISLTFDRVENRIIAVEMNAGDSALRTFTPHVPMSDVRWAALLIDADNLSSAAITVNDLPVSSPARFLSSVPSGFRYEQTVQYIKALLAKTKGVPREKIHDWLLVEIPASALKSTENVIQLRASKPLRLYAQKDCNTDGRLCIPALRYFSVTKMFASADGLEGRINDGQFPRLSNSHSVLHRHGVQQELVNQSLRMFLLTAPAQPKYIENEAGHEGSQLHLL